MPLTIAQIARNNYGAKIKANADPAEIARARGELEFAKARQTAVTWCSLLSADQLAVLAEQLQNGGAGDAA